VLLLLKVWLSDSLLRGAEKKEQTCLQSFVGATKQQTIGSVSEANELQQQFKICETNLLPIVYIKRSFVWTLAYKGN